MNILDCIVLALSILAVFAVGVLSGRRSRASASEGEFLMANKSLNKLQTGFSTAATEALIVGTPVCTVEVSGMKEMLGENNEWGIVTENSEEALYQGIKLLLDSPDLLAHYKSQAILRGRNFRTAETVKDVEQMLIELGDD